MPEIKKGQNFEDIAASMHGELHPGINRQNGFMADPAPAGPKSTDPGAGIPDQESTYSPMGSGGYNGGQVGNPK